MEESTDPCLLEEGTKEQNFGRTSEIAWGVKLWYKLLETSDAEKQTLISPVRKVTTNQGR